MAQLLMTPDGKKVLVDDNQDECIYEDPTGTAYTTDLHAHKARSGKVYFYSHSWSMWQGIGESYHLLTEGEAKAFLLERSQIAGHVAVTRSEAYFPNLFDEDA
jgi:hypothetical protein